MRFRSTLVVLLVTVALVLGGCTPAPILSDDAARQIKDALGYVLAPTWLPKGFAPAKAIDGASYVMSVGPKMAGVPYSQETSDRQFPSSLHLSYPESYGKSSPLAERLGLNVPEDAVSETSINGETAYLFHGRWTEETLERLTRLDMSVAPEWGYDNGHVSLRFTFVIPTGERIWVILATVFPTDQVTEHDIVRIAESIVVVD